MSIRILNGDDAATYQALRLRALKEHPESFGRSYEEEKDRPLENIVKRLANGQPESTTFGAFVDDELVGIIGIHHPQDREKSKHRVHIGGMYVAAEHQGKKFGQALLDAALNNIRARDEVMMVILAVTVGNLPARNLYRKAGFITWGVDPHYLRIGETFYDIEWMALYL